MTTAGLLDWKAVADELSDPHRLVNYCFLTFPIALSWLQGNHRLSSRWTTKKDHVAVFDWNRSSLTAKLHEPPHNDAQRHF